MRIFLSYTFYNYLKNVIIKYMKNYKCKHKININILVRIFKKKRILRIQFECNN